MPKKVIFLSIHEEVCEAYGGFVKKNVGNKQAAELFMGWEVER